MNTNAQVFIKTILSIVLSAGLIIHSKAQNVQQGSIWAPANIKIDAKLNEWNNSLQANNKTTNLYYTIANDDKNLYLAVKSTDQNNSNKIAGGGITFTVNTSGKKKDKDAFVIFFPVVNRASMPNQFRQRGGGGNGQPQMPDSVRVANMRNQLLASAKEITIKGFKDIPDSVIAIYNEYGIKAAVGYDNNGSFIYELALPLKELGLSTGSTKELAYNIKVNGIQFYRGNRDNNDGNPQTAAGNNGGRTARGGGDGFGGGGFGGGRSGAGGRFGGGNLGGMNMQDMMSPTDFWGKYTLAKSK
ncbi:DOMON domain-containing protein [Mucilaginibacter arboris]|uniref:Uncharacterized protein n=1 Tax=Mucilaginibacter arboris TaxID=2682090 RepID=A0A7K1ST92_9SPHI|nr:hypothetical protein [Mucilaginibacter arboris]MVN20320.1 hypothetical protein [Mucilaginibacter arboris]